MVKVKVRITWTLLVLSIFLNAENVYFVDGYHGGVYGHYPLEWETRFIIDNFYKYPDWRICLEIEPETWDSVKVRTPQDYTQFKQILSDERIEFTNPAYAQPYCYNISGESIIRQFQYGMRKINQHFPDVTFSTYSSEEPCFTSCLPQLLKSFGFQYAVLKCPNTCWGGYTRAYGKDLVNWVGPDTTSILAVPRYQCESFEKNSTWQTIAWNNST
ncbi:MAG TPA: alpha-mannosidase, partial [Paludibacteraceae bacterium]|nr:alpha-mannosidase [Paludibacteraceae bacterium]